MALPELVNPTGITKVDSLLRGFIGLCELAFPGRVAAYCLGGSYADGHAIDTGPTNNSSDLDIFAIFKGEIAPEEEAKFNELVLCCRQFGTIGLDAHPASQPHLLNPAEPSILNTFIKIASLHLFGEDIRDQIPQLAFPHYVQEIINHGLYHSGLPRRGDQPPTFPLAQPLVYPLTLPDPGKPVLGYDMPTRYPDGTQGPPGTRLLITIALWSATLNLILKTNRYTGTKAQSVRLYGELVHDEWWPLVEEIFYKCKKEWSHEIPATEADREKLRELARHVPDIENFFLRLARDFMLDQLRTGDKAARLGALLGFQCVVFPQDRAVLEAVQNLQSDLNQDLAATADATIRIISGLSQ